MKIALLGYGKMGKIIDEVAQKRGHEIVLKIDKDNFDERTPEKIAQCDVAIEFTNPHSAFDNVMFCLQNNIPIVCGSTGWLDKFEEAKAFCIAQEGSFIYSSNYSVGVNIFFELNKKLAALMAPHNEYEVMVEEIHHTAKKDAPSGTAVTLAQTILDSHPTKKSWINEAGENPEQLNIISKRIDPAPGTHIIKYTSAIDDIEITHTAHNRLGFATGAVVAAEFIVNKKGIFSMKDVLGIG